MEIDVGFWPPCPLWTGTAFLFYSITISATCFDQCWSLSSSELLKLCKCLLSRSFPYQKEKSQMIVKVAIVPLQLCCLPLPALLLHPLHPQGRPALLGPLPGHHGVPWTPSALSGGLGGIHFCYLAEYLLVWSLFSRPRLLASSGSFWSF